MDPDQREEGRVVEIPHPPPVVPAGWCVAILAGDTELAPVVIGMAVDTRGRDEAELEDPVTTEAVDRLVSEPQRKTGLRVIEDDRVEQRVPTLGRMALLARDIERAVGGLLGSRGTGAGRRESHEQRQNHERCR
jgi:hypothetical protein